jgi:hypothetical protein
MIDKALARAALLQYAEEMDGWASFGAYTNYYDSKGKVYEVPGLGSVVIIDFNDYDSDKSYDGWSEKLWIVFDIQGTLYRAKGTYTSYVGSDWEDELEIVEPKEKTIIVYESVGESN